MKQLCNQVIQDLLGKPIDVSSCVTSFLPMGDHFEVGVLLEGEVLVFVMFFWKCTLPFINLLFS